MGYVTMVRDASWSSKKRQGVIVHGYHGCMTVAYQNGAGPRAEDEGASCKEAP